MGALIYGPQAERLEVSDRLLAHLRLVIVSKLRRGESFAFNWAHGDGDGKSTVWMQPTMHLVFEFELNAPHDINRAWAEHLAETANSVRGLWVIPEEEAHLRSEDELGPGALPN
jgi:hypothetical protein